MVCSVTFSLTIPLGSQPAARSRQRSQLAALERLLDRGLALVGLITAGYRGDAVSAFSRVTRCIELLMFLISAVAGGQLIGPAAARGDAPADRPDRDHAQTGDRAERQDGESSERLVDVEGGGNGGFSRWLSRPMDDLIAHVRREFARVERRAAPPQGAADDQGGGGSSAPQPRAESPRSSPHLLDCTGPAAGHAGSPPGPWRSG